MTNPDTSIVFHAIEVDGAVMVLHDGETYGRPKMAGMTTPPVPIQTDNGSVGSWAWWGNNDRQPTEWRCKVEEVPMAGTALKKRTDFMMGEDLVWYKTSEWRVKGFEAEPQFVPEVDDFMEENRIRSEWWPAQCADYCLHYNSFSEMIMSNDMSKITNLYHIAAEHGRLSKANIANQVDFLLYSLHFPFGTAQGEKNRVAIPLYKWWDRERFFAGLQKPKFAWHSRFPTPGLIYYARAWHMGLFKADGWMDVASDVPKIVRAMQKNQVKLRYMIYVPEHYFKFQNKDWDDYDAAKRKKIVDEKQKQINDYLTGSENVGKTLMNIFRVNEITGQEMGKIEIVPVADNFKSDTWIPDSYTADAQIVQGLGVDPSQIGLAPQGGKMGAGSGSDKMQSFNQTTLLNTPDQVIELEPLNLISRFNRWGLTCAVKHTRLTTQNESRSGFSSPNPPGKNDGQSNQNRE